jgi:F-type H+-transporting ATPase subunit b
MEVISNVALISINATLVVQLLSFLIFLFLIDRVMFRPLQKTMQERQFQVEKIKKDITKADASYLSILKEIEDQEKTVRKTAFKLRQQHEDTGNNEAKNIYREVRSKIESLKHETEADIKKKLTEARKQVRRESEKLGVILIEQVMERRLS